MTKTYQSRILNILATEEQKGNQTVFNRPLANRRFKNVYDVHGTIMRIARFMATDKLLKRVGPGQFKLTPKGRKVAVKA